MTRRSLRLATALVWFIGTISLAAESLQKDLGMGLSYFRTDDTAAESAALVSALQRPAVVIDLRNSSADEASAKALATALAQAASRPRTLRVFLLNDATSRRLIDIVCAPRSGTLTIAPKNDSVTPDIAVPIGRDEDRRAYEAPAKGVPLEQLVDGAQDKRRFDEASLTREHNNGTRSPERADNAGDSKANGDRSEKDKNAPPVDLVLQRAIHVHRGLVALKKL